MKSPRAATLSLLAGLAIMAGSGPLLADPIASSTKSLTLRNNMKDPGKDVRGNSAHQSSRHFGVSLSHFLQRTGFPFELKTNRSK
jgi:hypothetical protein